ncbi:MAG: hypothetical protein OXI61_20235, partial [Candidatus Poribacteria bacterium]|nr:hypothetical protein [Candidatus Poribacteria bacterium]
MLSKKMAFSLMSLITIFALAFVASTAMAADGGPTVTISTADHHFDDGKQVVPTEPETATPDTIVGDTVVVTIEFSDVVDFNYDSTTPVTTGTDAFDPEVDVMFVYTNNDGVEKAASTTTPTWVQKNGKKYEGTITLAADNTKIIVYVAADAAKAITGSTQGKGNQASGAYQFSIVAMDNGSPMPVRVTKLIPESDFTADKVSGPFDVKIVLSEKPKEFKAAHIGVANGSIGAVVAGGSIARADYISNDEDGVLAAYKDSLAADAEADPLELKGTVAATDAPVATGNDAKFYRYKVTITPDFKKDAVFVWVKDFSDRHLGDLGANMWRLPNVKKSPDDHANGKRGIKVGVDLTGVDKPTAAAGTSVGIADKTIIPMDGYLVVASDDGDGANDKEKSSETGIMYPGTSGKTADSMVINLAGSGRSARAQKYNVVIGGLRDLETFLINDGTIDLITEDGTGAVISEVMWGTDASLADPEHNQWIEIRNTSGAQISTKGYKLMFYEANEALPDMTDATNKIADRVSTRNWNIAGTGQSGRSSSTIGTGNDVEFVTTSNIVSMQRVIDAAGMAKDGKMASSWASSQGPSVNFMADVAGRIGSPGAMPINYPAPPAATPPKMKADVAMAADIVITEIMVDTGNGRLPQWIELNNVSGVEKSLDGWSLEIENSAADADTVGTSVEIDLSGAMLGVGGGLGKGGTMGKVLLLVAWEGPRSSSNLSALGDRIVDVSGQLEQKGRYQLLSDMAFKLTLIPPQTTGIVVPGDMAGNLDAAEAWEIPMSESGRSSLIRREMDAGMMIKGTEAKGWVLASDTSLVDGPATWYGEDEDAGTPGYDSGGPLPVELSHFRP